jgi:hypothetical protein
MSGGRSGLRFTDGCVGFPVGRKTRPGRGQAVVYTRESVHQDDRSAEGCGTKGTPYVARKTFDRQKIGLKTPFILGRCIGQVERQMNRSISRDLTATRAMALGEAALQPKLSASGRETLFFSCQVLQHLMGSDDKSLIMAEKVESWLPVAAELFGKNQGAAEN